VSKAQSRNRQIAFAILAPARRKGKMKGMQTHRIPLLLRLFIASVIAVFPAAIFAYPFGFCVFSAAVVISGGWGSDSLFGNILFAPALPFFLLFPNSGGGLSFVVFALGFPYAWLFFTIILTWLGNKRWKRNIVKESEGQLPTQETTDSIVQTDASPTAK